MCICQYFCAFRTRPFADEYPWRVRIFRQLCGKIAFFVYNKPKLLFQAEMDHSDHREKGHA